MPLNGYRLGRNGFESAPPASRLRLPNGGWHTASGRILGVSIAEPPKGIPIINPPLVLLIAIPNSPALAFAPLGPAHVYLSHNPRLSSLASR